MMSDYKVFRQKKGRSLKRPALTMIPAMESYKIDSILIRLIKRLNENETRL